MKSIFEFKSPWFISDLNISRVSEDDSVKLWFQVEFGDDCKSINLQGLNDLDVVSELLQSERVIVSIEKNSQREFGTVRIECWADGCYSEFWCDHAEM
ncbi:hypothetical protein A143_17120 [Vibrio splendidus ZS-139]|nr:hypothetical protein A143_17120 [Vibrio splendidus ZS-139]